MKTKNQSKGPLFSPQVLDFVTVATEFCAYLEQSEGRDRDEFVDTMRKLLPLLYVKASLLPDVEGQALFNVPSYVTEQDYQWLRAVLAEVLGDNDEYEDLVYDEGMQTEDARWQSVSEGLADIYQAVRDFVETYRTGAEELMEEALWAVRDRFELFWGGNLVDVLRRLHRIKFISR